MKVIVVLSLLIVGIVIFNIFSSSIKIGGTCNRAGGYAYKVYQTCKCFGRVFTVENKVASDGDFRDICLGIGLVNSSTL
ncbi:hypothetical protein HYS82_00690 [Candidatus Amesbacteria bacterium]|nr:hypothetical protein [Candidatus Amesbacteria bacterium]